jgi:hypothetical protein
VTPVRQAHKWFSRSAGRKLFCSKGAPVIHGFHQLHSIAFSQILAIDLGKFNNVVCLYDPATTRHSFVTVQLVSQVVHGF